MGSWPRIAGLRVVMSWPDSEFAPPQAPRGQARIRLAGLLGISLIAGGALAIVVALAAQVHAPAPAAAAAGTTGRGGAKAPPLRQSLPVSVAIPAIGVRSRLLRVGLNPDGTIQVPSLVRSADEAAWYKYSATPGQPGTAVIEGHVDSYHGQAVFYRLGALRPGNRIEVTLADGVTAVFRVTGVREYAKDEFPAKIVYGQAGYPALRLITCGGDFDPATGHYLSSVVVFASLDSVAHQS
ncbi:class F sortase [Trebonia kvetii]|uniref:Class F sortase n=1 Tax=Trebonia kvetii TaxID=2480626 RepID=A0A6P2C0B9_9ACTN|nr:class F sortase [Trebonia kvetii]TVZ04387.1 class F sortase [Trebonia kvetii]